MLKQDKAWAVAMLDRTKYTESMELLNTKRFKKITADSAAATERKIQKIFKK